MSSDDLKRPMRTQQLTTEANVAPGAPQRIGTQMFELVPKEYLPVRTVYPADDERLSPVREGAGGCGCGGGTISRLGWRSGGELASDFADGAWGPDDMTSAAVSRAPGARFAPQAYLPRGTIVEQIDAPVDHDTPAGGAPDTRLGPGCLDGSAHRSGPSTLHGCDCAGPTASRGALPWRRDSRDGASLGV